MDGKPAWLDARALLRATPFFVLIVLAAGLSYRYHVLLGDQRDRVDHTYQVIAQLETTLVALIDAETGQRGYVLTGDERYVAPYETARRRIPRALAVLRATVEDSAVQRRRVDDVARLVDRKFAELDETVVARRTLGFEAARAIVMDDRGRLTMDAVRTTIGALEAEELTLLDERSRAARTTECELLLTTVACATLSLVARAGLALVGRKVGR